jgi:hypothetical protein
MNPSPRVGRAWMAVPALAAGVCLLAGAPAFAADTAPIYTITQQGMSADQGAKLAGTLGIDAATQADGSFSYTGAGFGNVPQKTVGKGEDESGRPVVSQALDMAAIQAIKSLSNDVALKKASIVPSIVGIGGDLRATPSVAHTQLTLSDKAGRATDNYLLDTSVSYSLTLGGLPVSGQGAKLRIAFAGDGSVTQVSSDISQLARSKNAPIITVDDAAKQCAALYQPGVRQGTPTLGYVMPALSADQPAKQIAPTYRCNPSSELGTQAQRVIPAIAGYAPTAQVKAVLRGGVVTAAADTSGGAAPYSYKWSSSTTVLDSNTDPKLSYTRAPRDAKQTGETLTLEVTDANGTISTATIDFAGDGTASATSVPGGGGFGKLSLSQTDVGIENMVEEWQCAQDSANGFKSVMASHSIPTAFDFRGGNAWESDFKKASLGGDDTDYVDNVDMQWYTGHGWPGGFTFDGNHSDTQIVPSDADWGDRDLEWLQLESCEVLKDTNGAHDYFQRWGGTIDGLHMLNGFDTSAYCIGGGTGADFASYLFSTWYRSALTVRNAWAQMAFDKEPSGVVFRSMGNIGPGGVTNISDHFWGQGSVGPDISKASRTGMWAIAQTV